MWVPGRAGRAGTPSTGLPTDLLAGVGFMVIVAAAVVAAIVFGPDEGVERLAVLAVAVGGFAVVTRDVIAATAPTSGARFPAWAHLPARQESRGITGTPPATPARCGMAECPHPGPENRNMTMADLVSDMPAAVVNEWVYLPMPPGRKPLAPDRYKERSCVGRDLCRSHGAGFRRALPPGEGGRAV